MQAQRLDDVGAFRFQRTCHRLERIGGEELTGIAQLFNLLVAFVDVGFGHVLTVAVFFQHSGGNRLAAFGLEQANHVIGNFIDKVDGAGTDIEHDVHAAEFITVYHLKNPFASIHEKSRQKRRRFLNL